MSASRRSHCRSGAVLLRPLTTDCAIADWLAPGQRVEISRGIWAERLGPPIGLAHNPLQEATGTEHIDAASRGRKDSRHPVEELNGTGTSIRDVEGCAFSRLETHGKPRLLVDVTIERATLEPQKLAFDPALSDKPDAVNCHFNEPKVRNSYSDAPPIQFYIIRSGSRAYGNSASVRSGHAASLPDDGSFQLDLITQHCPRSIDHAKNSAEKRESQGEPLLQLNARHIGPVCVQCNANHSLKQRLVRVAWLAVALLAAIVVPLRVVEIHGAHADRDAAKARWPASSVARG